MYSEIKNIIENNEIDILESMPIPVVITDPDLDEPGPKILMCNKLFEELTGYTKKEIIGKTPRILQGDDSNYEAHEQLRDELKKHDKYEFQTVNYGKDKKPYDVLVTVQAIRNKNKELIGFMGFQKNISEQIRISKEIIRQQQDLQMILDATPFSIFFKDKNNKIIKVNKTVCDQLGLPGSEIEGKYTSDFWPNYADKYYQDDLEVIESGEPKLNIVEQYYTPKTGEIWVKTDKIPIKNCRGEIVGVLVLFADITEAKIATEKLKEAMKNISYKNKELENFAYVASHDLQEPLRMISSYLQLIEERYNDKLDKDGREFIRYAVEGSDRLKRLITGLLQYSRAGRMVNKEPDVRPCRVVRKAIKSMSMSINEKQADIQIDFPAKCSKTKIKADPDWIQQVFQNLISNSLKFCKEKPIIKISAKRDNGMIVFSISDNGIGIPPNFQKHIFTMFKRVHARNKYSGDGIGLALCKRIIESHNGKIWFETSENNGTTFFIGLPHEQSERSSNR